MRPQHPVIFTPGKTTQKYPFFRDNAQRYFIPAISVREPEYLMVIKQPKQLLVTYKRKAGTKMI
ncbi:hypothetical protein DKN53_07400, partial [Salmonella enterica]|nr:hypothetical protein [Salmonella enterica]